MWPELCMLHYGLAYQVMDETYRFQEHLRHIEVKGRLLHV